MIVAKNVGKKINTHWIFRNVFLEIFPHDTIVILGKNGSGKTLLLKALSRLIPFTEGTLEYTQHSFSMCFQQNALFDSLTALENLTFVIRHVKHCTLTESIKIANEFLEQTQLYEARYKYPYQLSGGMQKRLAIARALVLQPDLILYDEPTAGLDPLVSHMILQVIQNGAKTNVIVTNNIKIAQKIATRVFLLHQQQLICTDPTSLKGFMEMAL